MATVVFLHAHPDDEAIFTGGTMAALAHVGHRVVLAVATSGELGLGPSDEAALARVRQAETIAAAEILGIHRTEFLGYRDSGMNGEAAQDPAGCFLTADVEAVAEQVVALLRDEGAGALVVYDEEGVYGHPDHVKVHNVGRLAARLSGVPTFYEATIDGEYLHFVEEHLVDLARDPTRARASVGVPTVFISNVVDVRPFLDRKREAIAAHASQIEETSAALTMAWPDFEAVYGHEWFVRTGPPGPIDELAPF